MTPIFQFAIEARAIRTTPPLVLSEESMMILMIVCSPVW